MKSEGKYLFDKGTILQKAYTLLCVFFANKEIARTSNPSDPNDPLRSLEDLFFTTEASRLLIEIAIAIRVLDDQMQILPITDKTRIRYDASKKMVDSFEYALFDDLNLNLRETCNKIIHSEIMEPHFTDGTEPHELDFAYRQGEGDKEINWQHINGYVRLSGTKGKQVWYVLLDLKTFISGVYKLMAE